MSVGGEIFPLQKFSGEKSFLRLVILYELKSVSSRGGGYRDVLRQHGGVGALGVSIIQYGVVVVQGVRLRVTALDFGHVVSQSFQVYQNLL